MIRAEVPARGTRFAIVNGGKPSPSEPLKFALFNCQKSKRPRDPPTSGSRTRLQIIGRNSRIARKRREELSFLADGNNKPPTAPNPLGSASRLELVSRRLQRE